MPKNAPSAGPPGRWGLRLQLQLGERAGGRPGGRGQRLCRVPGGQIWLYLTEVAPAKIRKKEKTKHKPQTKPNNPTMEKRWKETVLHTFIGHVLALSYK